jgi:pyridinium-3,5-bisthiocarboxylic acid mononucleotide nickel chelatase
MIVYFDCVGGAAGDMLLASLIDAGAPLDAINAELRKLSIPGLVVGVTRTLRHSIDSAHINVTWDTDEGAHHHADRPYVAIRALIESAGLDHRVQARALAIFARLAEAEARIHGVEIADVHFHEVGSEDSIADIVGVAIALELLHIDEVRSSPLPVGRGFVTTAHGVLPLPAPATLAVLAGVPIFGVDIEKELVTPTGAAIIATLCSAFGVIPSMSVSQVGYGAGTRDLPQRPNIIRALIGEVSASVSSVERRSSVMLIETNLDDCSPELIPDASEAATLAGALDVWVSPVFMKKNRPGFVLHALARHADASAVAQALLTETSALGVRMCAYERIELERSFIEVLIEEQTVRVKCGHRDGQVVNIAPEHDHCAEVAKRLGVPVKEVFARALVAARHQLEPSISRNESSEHV